MAGRMGVCMMRGWVAVGWASLAFEKGLSLSGGRRAAPSERRINIQPGRLRRGRSGTGGDDCSRKLRSSCVLLPQLLRKGARLTNDPVEVRRRTTLAAQKPLTLEACHVQAQERTPPSELKLQRTNQQNCRKGETRTAAMEKLRTSPTCERCRRARELPGVAWRGRLRSLPSAVTGDQLLLGCVLTS